MQMNLHSRIASRVLLRMAQTAYVNENDIYDLALAQPWEDWFAIQHTLRIDVTAIKSPLKSLEFTTLKIKDAICDRFRDLCGERPSVDTKTPDMRIVGFLDTSRDAAQPRDAEYSKHCRNYCEHYVNRKCQVVQREYSLSPSNRQ